MVYFWTGGEAENGDWIPRPDKYPHEKDPAKKIIWLNEEEYQK